MDNGNGAVTHGVHLRQAAGLGLGGHQVDVAAGVDAGSQAQVEGDLSSALLGILSSQILEEGLVLSLAGAQDQQLALLFPQQTAGDVAQQIQALVAGQTGDHDHQGDVGIDGQTDFFLQGSLTGGLADLEGVLVEVSGQSCVGLGVEGVGVNAVGDAGELPCCVGQDAVQTVSVVGVHQLTSIGLGNGGDQVSGLNGALHDVDGAAHIQDRAVLPGQIQAVVEEAGAGPALVLDVVNGVHAASAGEHITVDALQVGGDQSSLPVIALNDVGNVVLDGHCIQAGTGEESETLAVVHVAVDSAGTACEVVLVVDEVNGNIGTVSQLQQVSGLLTPAQSDLEGSDVFDRILVGSVLDLLVVGEEQRDLIALDAGQCGRQCLHDVAQTAGLGVGCAFGSNYCNFHTVLPLLTTKGFSGVPQILVPGWTVTFLSRMTYFSSAPAPMTASFMMTQLSTSAPSPTVT